MKNAYVCTINPSAYQYGLVSIDTRTGRTDIVMNSINHVEITENALSRIRSYLVDDGMTISYLTNWIEVVAYAYGGKLDSEYYVSTCLATLKNALIEYSVETSAENRESAKQALNAVLNEMFSEDNYKWSSDNRHVNRMIRLIGKVTMKVRARNGRSITGNVETDIKSDRLIFKAICQSLVDMTQRKLKLKTGVEDDFGKSADQPNAEKPAEKKNSKKTA